MQFEEGFGYNQTRCGAHSDGTTVGTATGVCVQYVVNHTFHKTQCVPVVQDGDVVNAVAFMLRHLGPVRSGTLDLHGLKSSCALLVRD